MGNIVRETLYALKSQSKTEGGNKWLIPYTEALENIKKSDLSLFKNDIEDHDRRKTHTNSVGLTNLYRWAVKRFLYNTVPMAREHDPNLYIPHVLIEAPLGKFYEILWNYVLTNPSVREGNIEETIFTNTELDRLIKSVFQIK